MYAVYSITSVAARDYPDVVHSLDIWHKAKKLRKALEEVYIGQNY